MQLEGTAESKKLECLMRQFEGLRDALHRQNATQMKSDDFYNLNVFVGRALKEVKVLMAGVEHLPATVPWATEWNPARNLVELDAFLAASVECIKPYATKDT